MDNIVRKAISGDKQAFIDIIGNNAEKLYRIALSYLKDRDAAQEAVQETTYRAYTNIKRLKTAEFFDTWLVRILINYCNNELKRRRTILQSKFPKKVLAANEDLCHGHCCIDCIHSHSEIITCPCNGCKFNTRVGIYRRSYQF